MKIGLPNIQRLVIASALASGLVSARRRRVGSNNHNARRNDDHEYNERVDVDP
jgi:hypothetical protein